MPQSLKRERQQEARTTGLDVTGAAVNFKRDEPADLVTAGLPCQPFTFYRWTGGHTANTGKAEQHEGYYTTMDSFKINLQERRPLGFLVENTKTFMVRTNEHGQTFLQVFQEHASAEGYATCADENAASVWSETPRDRCMSVHSHIVVPG